MIDIAKPMSFRNAKRKSFVDAYILWILLGLVFAMLLLVMTLFYSDYQQNAILERLWDKVYGGLGICP